MQWNAISASNLKFVVKPDIEPKIQCRTTLPIFLKQASGCKQSSKLLCSIHKSINPVSSNKIQAELHRNYRKRNPKAF